MSQPTGAATYDPATERLVRRANGAGRDSLVYDRAGNLVELREASGAVWAYGYDALEELVSVRWNGTLIARYGYDVLGRRIVKRVYSSLTGGTVGYTRFVYHGSQVAWETDSAGTVGLRYTWGPGADALVAVDDGSTHYYAVTDQLGSVRSLATRDGTWLLTQRFTPYGETLARDSSGANAVASQLRYRWTGREYDAETGFYFFRARSYSPSLRRFVQADPLGYGGGANLYAYVDGSVLEATDPSGMDKDWEHYGAMVDPEWAWLAARMEGPTDYIDGVSAGYGAGSFVGAPGTEADELHPTSSLGDDAWAEQMARRDTCDPPDSPKCLRERIEGPTTTTDPGLADPIFALIAMITGGGALKARGASAAAGGGSTVFASISDTGFASGGRPAMPTTSKSPITSERAPRLVQRHLRGARPPTSPGEMLLEEFLKPLGISQSAFAARLGVSFPRLNEIVHAKRAVTPDTALRLAQVTGMSADFWLGLQQDWDLWHALRSRAAAKIAELKPPPKAG